LDACRGVLKLCEAASGDVATTQIGHIPYKRMRVDEGPLVVVVVVVVYISLALIQKEKFVGKVDCFVALAKGIREGKCRIYLCI